MFLFYLKNNWKNSYSHNFNFEVRLMIGVRTLCHLMTKSMEPSPSKWWSCYKVYIVANKILSQNQSLFLAFWLRKWPFLQLYTKKTGESDKKKTKQIKNHAKMEKYAPKCKNQNSISKLSP